MHKIPNRKHCRCNLPEHGGDRRACHAPPTAENEDGVEYNVDASADQVGDHGKARIAVRADDRIHRLPEHVERNAERDPKEVFLRQAEGLCIDLTAERREDRLGKGEISRRQNKADRHADRDGTADAPRRAVGILLTERDADKRAAAVADHDRDAERDHRQREYNGICSVAVRPEIGCVGDEDLINDVVERADQQRNNAGDGISAHQLADLLCSEGILCLIIHFLTSEKIKAA